MTSAVPLSVSLQADTMELIGAIIGGAVIVFLFLKNKASTPAPGCNGVCNDAQTTTSLQPISTPQRLPLWQTNPGLLALGTPRSSSPAGSQPSLPPRPSTIQTFTQTRIRPDGPMYINPRPQVNTFAPILRTRVTG